MYIHNSIKYIRKLLSNGTKIPITQQNIQHLSLTDCNKVYQFLFAIHDASHMQYFIKLFAEQQLKPKKNETPHNET